MGWFNPPPPIINLVTWVFNNDFLCTGNQQINANMVNVSATLRQLGGKDELPCECGGASCLLNVGRVVF